MMRKHPEAALQPDIAGCLGLRVLDLPSILASVVVCGSLAASRNNKSCWKCPDIRHLHKPKSNVNKSELITTFTFKKVLSQLLPMVPCMLWMQTNAASSLLTSVVTHLGSRVQLSKRSSEM